MRRALRKNHLVAALALLLSVSLLLPPLSVPALAAPEKIDQEDKNEAQNDLDRAKDNSGVSPDRVVVVYDQPTPTDDPRRDQVRQFVAGKLLKANRALAEDVLRVANGDAPAVAEAIKNLPGVKDAYADRVAQARVFTANDKYYVNQTEWGIYKIKADTAWSVSTGKYSNGTGVKVAVLDCGIHSAHPDLSGKVSPTTGNFTSAATVDDKCDHGTHVAGTVAAATNNSIGVAGVAPDAIVLNGKVLDDHGSGFFSWVDAGIQWAADNGAKVVSMSLEGDTACSSLSGTQNAVNYAFGKGAVSVAAAGNSGQSHAGAPANCDNVVGVAATDSADNKASWSNYSANVDVAGPGVGIISTVNSAVDGGYQGDPDYNSFSGTSMATPHVSGVAALVWATGNYTSPSDVVSQICNTADKINGTGSLWSCGRINAAKAVGASVSQQTPDFTISSNPTSQSITAGGPSQTYTVNLTGQNSYNSPVNLSVSGAPSGVTATFQTNPVTPTSGGATTTLTVSASSSAAAGGPYSLQITGTGTDSNQKTHSTTVTLNVTASGGSTADFSLSANPTSLSIKKGGSTGTTSITVTPSGGFTSDVTLSASQVPSGFSVSFSPAAVSPGGQSTMTITSGNSNGTVTINVNGSGGGQSQSTSVKVTIKRF